MLARALLVSLLLMNLGVAAWWGLRTPPPEPRPPAVESGITPLRLLSETEAPDTGLISADAEAVGQPAPAGAVPDQRCLQIGPFLTQADLRRAMNALSPSASRIQFRENRVLTNRGFWVFLPAQGTREAALAAARELSAQGLRDYYVVTAGDQENTISLGLFRDRNTRKLAAAKCRGWVSRPSCRSAPRRSRTTGSNWPAPPTSTGAPASAATPASKAARCLANDLLESGTRRHSSVGRATAL